MDSIHPHLEIIANTEYYEIGSFAVKVAAIVAGYIGLCSLVFVPVVRTIVQREKLIKVADSATVGQNFQWAQKLPLRGPIMGLPGFGIVGGMFFAIMAMLLMFGFKTQIPEGLWVHLLKPRAFPEKSDSWTEPLIVRLRDTGLGSSPKLYVNSTEVAWDDLGRVVKQELSRRREWVVYVTADNCLPWVNVTAVIDIAHGEQAKVILFHDANAKDCELPPNVRPPRI